MSQFWADMLAVGLFLVAANGFYIATSKRRDRLDIFRVWHRQEGGTIPRRTRVVALVIGVICAAAALYIVLGFIDPLIKSGEYVYPKP